MELMDGWFGPKPQYAQNITQKTEEKPFVPSLSCGYQNC
jgi:hypothetical protein